MSTTLPPVPARGLLVSGDLIFSTKVTGTARALGREVEVVGSPDAALELIRRGPPGCVLLDLGLVSLASDQIRTIVQAAAGRPVFAFGSHVDVARLEDARAAGCTEVLPRSRFAATLPQLLMRYLPA